LSRGKRASGYSRAFDECTAGKSGFHILKEASNYYFLAYDATAKGNIERSLDKSFIPAGTPFLIKKASLAQTRLAFPGNRTLSRYFCNR